MKKILALSILLTIGNVHAMSCSESIDYLATMAESVGQQKSELLRESSRHKVLKWLKVQFVANPKADVLMGTNRDEIDGEIEEVKKYIATLKNEWVDDETIKEIKSMVKKYCQK